MLFCHNSEQISSKNMEFVRSLVGQFKSIIMNLAMINYFPIGVQREGCYIAFLSLLFIHIQGVMMLVCPNYYKQLSSKTMQCWSLEGQFKSIIMHLAAMISLFPYKYLEKVVRLHCLVYSSITQFKEVMSFYFGITEKYCVPETFSYGRLQDSSSQLSYNR